MKDEAVENTENVELTYEIELKRKVAVDARLDTVEIDDSYTVKRSSSRQSILWGRRRNRAPSRTRRP